MKCLKQYLSRNRWNSNPQFHHQDQLQHENGQYQEEECHGNENTEMEASVKQETEKKPRFTFIPGVIVRAVLDEPVVEVRKFKVRCWKLMEVTLVSCVCPQVRSVSKLIKIPF
jgi:hypothetical protein